MAASRRSCRSFSSSLIGFWLLLHRTTVGRAFYAIGLVAGRSPVCGHSRRAASRRLFTCCRGAVASLAAMVYVAHLGQAKADAGTGYELMAITAVVLGGTSIFGGRGTIFRHGSWPFRHRGACKRSACLAGAAVRVGRHLDRRGSPGHYHRGAVSSRAAPPVRHSTEEWEVKNSQVAVLSAVILLGCPHRCGQQLAAHAESTDRIGTARAPSRSPWR